VTHAPQPTFALFASNAALAGRQLTQFVEQCFCGFRSAVSKPSINWS
jgi:hypothetical protein